MKMKFSRLGVLISLSGFLIAISNQLSQIAWAQARNSNQIQIEFNRHQHGSPRSFNQSNAPIDVRSSTTDDKQQASLLSRVASFTGQAAKMSLAPLVQLDTSSKYYKLMIEGMVNNFKNAVSKASDQAPSRNLTSLGSLSVGGQTSPDRVTCSDLQVDGLARPRVTSVRVNKGNMKLSVAFGYKSIKLTGRCVSSDGALQVSASPNSKPLLDSIYWNASWTASIMPMVGREHFDLNQVETVHKQQKNTFGLKEIGQQTVRTKLEEALLERLKSAIDGRLIEIMEIVMMGQELEHRNTMKKLERTEKEALKRHKRQTPCQPGEELDDYVDQLFRFGTRIVRAMEPITLPNATIELPDYNLKIFLYEGKGTRAYKFRRTKGAWVFCSNETISLGLTIEVEELRVAYKYRVISGTRLLFDGDLEAKLSPKIQTQFSQAVQEEDSEEPVQQRVDRIRLFRLGRVHVLIRGLGNLTQSLSMIINSYLNDNQEELQPTFRMVEGDAVKMVNKILANVNVPLLSVV